MCRELLDAFDRADADDAVRVVIVTGAGTGFCAGADLGSGSRTFDSSARIGREPIEEHRDGGGLLTLRIFDCKKPVIAAINGAAVGVGITMTLPMDVRIASTAARMGFVFARRAASCRKRAQLVSAARGGYQPGRGVGLHRARVRRGRSAGAQAW